MKKVLKIGLTCLAASTLALSVATAITLGVSGSDDKQKFTVTFDTRGGSTVASYKLEAGEVVARPSAVPTKDMFVFGDWYTDTTYKTKFEFGGAMPDHDLTVFAGWIGEGSIKLEYNANGGAFEDGAVKKSEPGVIGTKLTAIAAEPKFEGYIFDGWYTEPECDNKFDFEARSEDITLYAGWANDPDYAYASYYGNGEFLAKTPIKKGTSHTAPKLFDSSVENTGWFTDVTLNDAYTFGKAITSDIFLYTTYYSKGLVINGNTVVRYDGNAAKVIVPDAYNSTKITVIGKHAFYRTSEKQPITEIVLPDTIEELQEGAFYDCRYLVKVNLTEKITAIPKDSFYNNERLKSVGDISKVRTIGDGAFLGCKALRSIELPDTLTSVGGYAFTNCSMLTEFVLPARVNAIGEYAFSGCTALRTIEIKAAALDSIGECAFENCYDLERVIIRSSDAPDFPSEFGESPFVDCVNAKIYVPVGAIARYEDKYSHLDEGKFVEMLEQIGADDE